MIARRSRGLSVGVNLNPDQVCSFSCVYCQVDRSRKPPVNSVDFDQLSRELRILLADPGQVFNDKRFQNVPDNSRAIRDIAFSGNGEPTASPAFPAAAGLVAELQSELNLRDAKILVLTNGCCLRKPSVIQTLAFLDNHNGEYWIKLDAGTQEHFERVNRSKLNLEEHLNGILVTARVRPIVIQSMFMRIDDQPPLQAEIDAYVGRIRWLLDNGGQIKGVQVYSVAREPAESNVSALDGDKLEAIAEALRKTGAPAECFV